DDRVNDIGLAAFCYLCGAEAPYFLNGRLVYVFGFDGLAAGRKFVDGRDIEISVDGQRQRAGDWRGGHDENVGFGAVDDRRPVKGVRSLVVVWCGKARGGAFFEKCEALHDTEPVLLIDNG